VLAATCLAGTTMANASTGRVKPAGWAFLGALGGAYALRRHIGPQAAIDIPVALAGLLVCSVHTRSLGYWTFLRNVHLRPDAALYTSRIETDKVMLGAAALLLHQLDYGTDAPSISPWQPPSA
jgi:hypothetical protein